MKTIAVTERLSLREMTEDDLDNLCTLFSDGEIMHYVKRLDWKGKDIVYYEVMTI